MEEDYHTYDDEPSCLTLLIGNIVLAILCFGLYQCNKAIEPKKHRQENPYLRKLPPRPERPAAKPHKRIRVEPDDEPTLLDIEDEVDRNGDDDLEYYDYILR